MIQLHTPRMSCTEGILVISVASRVTYWERAEIARVQVAALEQRFEAEEHRGQRPKKSFLSDHNRAHLRYYRMQPMRPPNGLRAYFLLHNGIARKTATAGHQLSQKKNEICQGPIRLSAPQSRQVGRVSPSAPMTALGDACRSMDGMMIAVKAHTVHL